jgi:pyruvate/2-oxoglutarate dehydrogenase complex dihydrolipoamide acyltransferase (E2) component
MADIVMPRLSDSMEEGTILTWMKKVGDEIEVGDEIVEIETDKANMAYESDVAGTLTEILAEEGATLAIGTPIARVGDDAEGSGPSAAGPVTAGDPPLPAVAKASSGVGPPTVPPVASGSVLPEIDSCVELFPTAEFQEREAFDFFGVVFRGHPDLTRILLPEDYVGWPQRRDFPVGGEPVTFTYNERNYG